MSVTIVVEDGSGAPYVINANSYASVDMLIAYAAARQYTLVNDPSSLLIEAMDYIDSLLFIGLKINRLQPLQWPRYDVYVDNWYVPYSLIPYQLPNALCAAAIAIDQGVGPLVLYPRRTTVERVGDLEVTYNNNSNALPICRTINQALYKLLAAGTPNSNNIRQCKG